MAIKQLTVFVENKQGALVSITDTLAANDINLRALSIAETQDFGILRLIVNDEKKAEKTLSAQMDCRRQTKALTAAFLIHYDCKKQQKSIYCRYFCALIFCNRSDS